MTSIICNGVRPDAREYSAKATLDLKLVIREVRKYFLVGDDSMAGVRFNSDDLVLLSIRSNATEEAALLAPFSWAHAALEDCSSRDYHYAFEKKWTDDEPEEAGSFAEPDFF